MPEKIAIQIGSRLLEAELNDTAVAGRIARALPITAKASTWGDEIYFQIPVKTALEKGVTEVNKFDLGYWPEGACFCIFFGPTPVSRGEKIIPASAVEIIGKLAKPDYAELKKVRSGESITVRSVENV